MESLSEDLKHMELGSYNKSLADYYNIVDHDLYQRADLFNLEWIKDLRDHGHYHYRRESTSGSGPLIQIRKDGDIHPTEMINLASNDYLNLTKHPKVISAGIDAIQKYGAGAGSVPLLGGTLDIHLELEKKIAKFKGCEDAIIYTSGFGSNCSTLLSMLGEGDIAILDSLVHASIMDGCTKTTTKSFLHNNCDSLETILKRYSSKYRTKLVVVDGVYSMDGDIAKLDQIVSIAKKYNAYVMVDEAHATGVIGQTGKGTPEYFSLEGKVDIVAGTFSKGLGVVGGFVAGKKELIELLRFYSRAYMFSTAMTPQATASTIAAINVVQNEPELINKLWRNISYFREKLLSHGFNIGLSETAIFPIIIGDQRKVKEAVRLLEEQNIYANSVLYPAVRIKESRIRMTVTAQQSLEQLDTAVEALMSVDRSLQLRQNSLKLG
ncbi:aminotransferase class I/II-fold pyridoxal phosphate-dependent enzyme [Photobacterium sagamiensis]|uniref:aminotransferase class I/II-fold pyridoxal phosphate-dependent enzyme n=1 Tax=Photobacterium sagamiensis TaxID=2910241 RepID=UPI003D09C949